MGKLPKKTLSVTYTPVDTRVDVPLNLRKKNVLDSGVDVRACFLNMDKTPRAVPGIECYYDPAAVNKISDTKYVVGRGKTVMVRTGIIFYLLEETLADIYLPIFINGDLQLLKHMVGIQVRPRSGLAYKKAVTVLNSPGTIDQNYTQELGVIFTVDEDDFEIEHGDRIAQIIPELVPEVEFAYQTSAPPLIDLDNTRQAGFGSTGLK